MRFRTASILLCAVLSASALPTQAQRAPATGERPVVAEGVVPDEATKAQLLARLGELYGAGRVVDRLRVEPVVAPPNWSENVAKLAAAQLRQVSPGKLEVNGNSVRISGQVPNEAQRQQVVNHLLTSLNASYSVDADGLRVGGSPQTLLDDVLADRIIEFESGSANLTTTGRAILDELVEPMRQIGDTRVQVIGHTDNVGARQANIALSYARAQAVREYFRQRGIPDAGLSVLGKGPDEPVADNATTEGRARNRRIQFKVL
ncbi:cell envelope biogenesis protein OmpA [Pseudoxanthomonas kalamensis DSM 18571]|uniref:OmpA family protein n=1 Tax=Pseudoxanthomonas kalamensis TaxID=289483 RepID=UPI001390E52A|nr:OmpA family protein [Pseudoxanthomonas kalamensis]KAF1712521.1 cell envelope biogenesis protein OmpA [Pseudoxanthomonas kalamensis DSM 18571]